MFRAWWLKPYALSVSGRPRLPQKFELALVAFVCHVVCVRSREKNFSSARVVERQQGQLLSGRHPATRDAMRIVTFIRELIAKRDVWGATLLGLCAAIGCWLIVLPFSSEVQRVTLRRVQFDSPSFANWSTLQIVPPMYGLENRYWFEPQKFSNGVPVEQPLLEAGYINHFPMRIITFFDNRERLLSQFDDSRIVVESRYQDEVFSSCWSIHHDRAKGVFNLVREAPQ
ncbi:MAG: hypothetical protein R3C03_05010 [Pirellulaceae bacterium]